MNKYLKIFLIVAIVGIIAGGGAVYYIFNMPARDVENEKPAFTLSAESLYNDFNSNEEAANLKYGNQVLQVSGSVVEKSIENYQVSITLNDEMEGINCALDSTTYVNHKELIDQLSSGENITLKGKCDGFDMIMGVVLTRCFIIED